jgi:outer membrane protein assembly factor BamB
MPKFVSALLAVLLSSVTVFASGWTQFRGPNFDGSTSGRIEPWGAEGPRVIWKRPIRSGFSSFVAQDQTLVTSVLREQDGVRVEACLALDASTGRERWVTLLKPAKYTNEGMPDSKDGGAGYGAPNNQGGDGPRSTPTINENRVFVMASSLTLFCLDLRSGEILWHRDLIRTHHGRAILYENAASPLVIGSLVLVGGGGPGESILGINKVSGEIVWKGLSEDLTHSTPTFAQIRGVPQAIFYTRSGLVSLRPESGEVLWRYYFPYRVCAAISPVVADDLVYCSAGYGIGAGVCKVNANGKVFSTAEIWRQQHNEPVANYWSTPLHKNGFLYGIFGFKKFNTAPMKCVDVKSGEVKWTQPGFGHGNVIAVGDRLVALAGFGDLVLIDPSPDSYRELARAKLLSGKCWSTPIFDDGRLYIRSTREAACIDFRLNSEGDPILNTAAAEEIEP